MKNASAVNTSRDWESWYYRKIYVIINFSRGLAKKSNNFELQADDI